MLLTTCISRAKSPEHAQHGFSLVELMVGMVIALIGTIIIFQVFSVSEGLKRTTTGVSDAQQTGSFSAYSLERHLRLGGSGLARVANIWGCALNSWSSTSGTMKATVPPASPGYPAGFTAIPANLRITPILIVNGGSTATDATPDTIVVMGGQHHSLNVPLRATAPESGGSSITLVNTVGINQNVTNANLNAADAPKDLLLAVEQDSTRATFGTCRVVQATGAAVTGADPVKIVANPVTLASGSCPPDCYTPTTPSGLTGYSAIAQLANLGPTPTFAAFAVVGAGVAPDSLLSYDLISGNAPTSIADNIVNMQATYGIVANPSAPISTTNALTWQPPVGGWSAATLMDGSSASRDKIASIRAVRIAIVGRSAQYEKDNVTPATVWKLFADLTGAEVDALPTSLTSTTTWQQYRYRTYEVTVPLRNMLLPST